MELAEFITTDIPTLRKDDLISNAQEIFSHYPYTHLPVLDENILLGNLSEEDTQAILDQNKTIEDFLYSLNKFQIQENNFLLEVLNEFARNETNILPILNDKGNYIGSYELTDIMNLFQEAPFLSESGNFLIVEKGLKEYSFSEIAQIIESNNAKVIGMYVSSFQSDKVQVTVKINSVSLNEIAQTFRRYSYNVISTQHDDHYLENLKERSDYLNKYLNI